MAIEDPRESAKARERQVDDGTFLGGDDFPPSGGPSDPGADPNLTDPNDLDPGNLDAGEPGDDAGTSLEWPEGLEIPSRLQGKTPEDVVKEWNSMQTEFGRQTTELGETRAAIRELMQSQLLRAKDDSTSDEADSKISLEALQDNPDDAIAKRIDQALKPLDERIQVAQVEAKRAELNSRYPGFEETVQSADFIAWKDASKYRKTLYAHANDYDFNAAEELLMGFTENQEARRRQAGVDNTTAARSHATVTGKGGGAGGVKRGRTYRYVDIANLYSTDRDRYNALFSEFEKAEAEGRIK